MKKTRVLGEPEVIATFLKYDFSSPHSLAYKKIIEDFKISAKIFTHPNLESNEENYIRFLTLQKIRGYKRNDLLFKNFPENIVWEKVSITKDELRKIHLPNYSLFVSTNNIRLVSEILKYVRAPHNEKWQEFRSNIEAISEILQIIKIPSEIICVTNGHDNKLVILDGVHRATAYLLNLNHLPDQIEIILGTSNQIAQWAYYA